MGAELCMYAFTHILVQIRSFFLEVSYVTLLTVTEKTDP